jgi:6-phosphogluconolactonase
VGSWVINFTAVEIDLASKTFGKSRVLNNTLSASHGVVSADGSNIYVARQSQENTLWQVASATGLIGSNGSTMGSNPSVVALNPNKLQVAVANLSGHVAIYSLNSQGQMVTRQQVIQPVLLNTSKVTWIGWHPSNGRLYVVDAGLGDVYSYTPNAQGVYGAPAQVLNMATFERPRELAFHPSLPRVYVLDEANNSVMTYRVTAEGNFTQGLFLSTLPTGVKVANVPYAIQVADSGRLLMLSNSGHNSIAVYALDGTGSPSLAGITPSQGGSPRAFRYFEKEGLLVVANYDTSDLALFSVAASGQLVFTGQKLGVRSPVFLEGSRWVRFGQGLSALGVARACALSICPEAGPVPAAEACSDALLAPESAQFFSCP